MARWKTDRTAIFFCLVFVLFLWDVVYFLGIRDPDRFPHPFSVFRRFGDVEFLRGFSSMLRHVISCSVLGGLIGVGAACLVIRSGWLTQAAVQVLRLGLWLPFMILFATPDPWLLGIAAAMFCSCYHYLVAISVLGLEKQEIRTHVVRETTLQVLLISLISQIWLQYWNWFAFAATYQRVQGLGVFLILVGLIIFIQWIFRSDFNLLAERRGILLREDLKSANWKWMCGFLLVALAFMILWGLVWQLVGPNSPLGVISAGYQLLTHGEIYKDIGVSLLELLGGIVLGGSIALLVVALMSADRIIRATLISLLPLSHISSLVLWLLSFLIVGRIVPDFINYWHKVLAVGCLVFFPFVQALWGLRDRAVSFRILMAIDNALPFAFVAMLFGELWAATAGLGFVMTVASATYQTNKGLAGFLITVFLLVALSTTVRWIVKRFYSVEKSRVVPVPVT